MRSLVEMFESKGIQYYPTDKHSHGYLAVYDKLFAPIQDQPIRLFEIGYFSGGSAKLFRDYFIKGQVHSIEVQPLMINFNEAVDGSMRRITTELKNSNEITKEYLEGLKGGVPDIVIDDGSHLLEDQLHVVKVVYPALKPGGMLIIEDIGDAFEAIAAFQETGFPFEVVDLRPGRHKGEDDIMIIFKK